MAQQAANDPVPVLWPARALLHLTMAKRKIQDVEKELLAQRPALRMVSQIAEAARQLGKAKNIIRRNGR